MTPAFRFGEVIVWTDGSITTPVGDSWLTQTDVRLGSRTPIVHSSASWSGGMVFASIVVALFTCGLGLLLLFLARSQTTSTVIVDTVELHAPDYYYVAQDFGGAQFVSWTQTWRQQLLIHELRQLDATDEPESPTATKVIPRSDPDE